MNGASVSPNPSPSNRPKLEHAESQPELINIHGPKSNEIDPQNVIYHTSEMSESESSSESDTDLLEYLNKLDQSYRTIKLKIPNGIDNHCSEIKANYEKRVSFDTVNLQYEKNYDDWYDEDSDDDYDDYDMDRGRGRGRGRTKNNGPSPNISPLHSPNGSPNRRMKSPMRSSLDNIDDLSLAKMLSNHMYGPEYPTTPIITHRGCTFTKLHRQFEDLYLQKLNTKEHNYLTPILPNRVILVYITGRKHTWVALDWILNKFIQNGDSVIIVSAINLNLLTKNRRRSSNFTSPEKIAAKTPRMRLRQRNRPEFVKAIAKNIMSYVMEVINPNVIAKVSIELAVGKSKRVLQEMYKLYEPNVVATGTKPNVNIGAPLRSWNSSRITDRLVKNFPLPVIIVPAVNMGSFEKQLELQVNSRYNEATKYVSIDAETPNTKILKKAKSITPSTSQPNSNRQSSSVENVDDDTGSISSLSSEESYSSFDEITNAYENYKNGVRNKLDELCHDGYNYNYFTESIKTISDKSADFCREIRGIDPNFKGRGAKLARAITGSNSFGVVPYKTKSLLAPIEKTKSAGPISMATSSTPSVTYKELKKRLKENQQQKVDKPPTPSINISSPPRLPVEKDSQPPKQTLKFVNLEAPSKEKLKDKKENKEKDVSDMKRLQKSFSNDVETYSDNSKARPKLEPLKSHPDLTSRYLSSTRSNSSDKGSEKKPKKTKTRKFWKLFS